LSILAGAVFTVAQELTPGAIPPLQIGDPTARNRVEVYGDYRCEASGVFFRNFRAMVARHPSEVVVIFRHFPLGKNSVAAIRAVEAAGMQGKFVQMMHLLYDNAEAWKTSDAPQTIFAEYAVSLGLDMKTFELDENGALTGERLARDMERAKAIGVTGTPWVLWNDRPMSYGDAYNLENVIFSVKE
jgi:protein-disulfide isomerase